MEGSNLVESYSGSSIDEGSKLLTVVTAVISFREQSGGDWRALVGSVRNAHARKEGTVASHRSEVNCGASVIVKFLAKGVRMDERVNKVTVPFRRTDGQQKSEEEGRTEIENREFRGERRQNVRITRVRQVEIQGCP